MTALTAARFLAHGIEGRRDLPLPVDLLVQGAVVALLASFFGLGVLWRSPRFRAGAAGWPVPLPVQQLVDSAGVRWLLRLLGLLGTAYVLAIAMLAGDDGRNPLPYVVYVLFWVGIVPLPAALLDTAGLLAMIVVVAMTFVAATLLAGRAGDRGRRPVPGLLAHTIIPIVVGYVIVHYFSLLLFQGQQGITLLAGSLDTHAAITPAIDYGLITTSAIAGVQVIAVVVGHVLAVISAHDRSVALFPQADVIIGQLPLMVLMVGYTVGGLTLLFAA